MYVHLMAVDSYGTENEIWTVYNEFRSGKAITDDGQKARKCSHLDVYQKCMR